MSSTEKPKRGRPPLVATEIADLEARLQPAALDDVDELLRQLLGVLPAPPGGGKRGERIAAYRVALDGVSRDAVQGVCRSILRGEISELNPAFMPTPPELARACRKHEEPLRRSLERAREIERQRAERVELSQKNTPAEIARRAAHVEQKLGGNGERAVHPDNIERFGQQNAGQAGAAADVEAKPHDGEEAMVRMK
jgi:hypothetical protein